MTSRIPAVARVARKLSAVPVVAALVASSLLTAGGPTASPALRSPEATGTAPAITMTSTTAAPAATTAAPRLRVGRNAWVAVSVTTLWRTPDSPREVDAPALTRPVHIERWLQQMTLTQRRALNGRADTQALLGDRVRVVRLRPGWARVVVPSQPSQLDRRGYPGWVPRRQLTAMQPTVSRRVATVVKRTAWLSADRADGPKLLRISFGTRLPVLGRAARAVRVVTPTGEVRRLAAGVVVVHDAAAPAIPPTRASLVSTATSFVGLPYLWSGLSGFGLDCSGLTWLDYRVHGIRIPRDALPQSQHGTAVRNPRPGDLMFYARAGRVHHVSMYVGNGLMVHAPGTGQSVKVVPISTPAYRREYAGARRYLP